VRAGEQLLGKPAELPLAEGEEPLHDVLVLRTHALGGV
jgi:hypothetical protein